MTAKERTRKTIHELYEKYYADRKNGNNGNGKIAIGMKRHLLGSSRNDLVLQAKQRGIKNFRVMNKEQLTEILQEDTTVERAQEIANQAVSRWKAGWSKNKAVIKQ